MNRYILIRRLRGPAILLLLGTLALLHQMGAIPYTWRLFWPLLLIMMGLLQLAERAAMAREDYSSFPGAQWQGASQVPNQAANQGSYQGAYGGAPIQGAANFQGAASTAANPGTAIVPAPRHDFENNLENNIEKSSEGGQS